MVLVLGVHVYLDEVEDPVDVVPDKVMDSGVRVVGLHEVHYYLGDP